MIQPNKREVLEKIYTSKDFKNYFFIKGKKEGKISTVITSLIFVVTMVGSTYGLTQDINYLLLIELAGLMFTAICSLLIIYKLKITDNSWEIMFGDESKEREKLIKEIEKDDNYYIKRHAAFIFLVSAAIVIIYLLAIKQPLLALLSVPSGIVNINLLEKFSFNKKSVKNYTNQQVFEMVYDKVLPFEEVRETDISSHTRNINSLIDELSFFGLSTEELTDLVKIVERLNNVTLVSVQVNYILPIIRTSLVNFNNNRDDVNTFIPIINSSLLELKEANKDSREHILKENKKSSELLTEELEQVKGLNKL